MVTSSSKMSIKMWFFLEYQVYSIEKISSRLFKISRNYYNIELPRSKSLYSMCVNNLNTFIYIYVCMRHSILLKYAYVEPHVGRCTL